MSKKQKKAPRKKLKTPALPAISSESQAPALSRAESAAQIRDILDRLFDGNAAEIVKTLADSGDLTPDELARMKEVFAKSKTGKNK